MVEAPRRTYSNSSIYVNTASPRTFCDNAKVIPEVTARVLGLPRYRPVRGGAFRRKEIKQPTSSPATPFSCIQTPARAPESVASLPSLSRGRGTHKRLQTVIQLKSPSWSFNCLPSVSQTPSRNVQRIFRGEKGRFGAASTALTREWLCLIS